MAADPIAKFEHVWHALMRVFGHNHRALWLRNKAIQNDIQQLMGRK